MPELNAPTSPLYRRPYFFDQGLRFTCQECGRCCTGAPGRVFLPAGRLSKVAALLERPAADLVRNDLLPAPGGFRIREDAGGRCRFLREAGGCRIYPVRPPQCISYPFWFQILRRAENWQALRRQCPGAGRGALFSKARILRLMNGSPPT
jgi:Fe-S-cluster containining protein